MRPSRGVRSLIAFWDACNPETSVEGFIGRCFYDEVQGRQECFKNIWGEAHASQLNVPEVHAMVDILTVDGDMISPSASSRRRLLLTILAQAR